MGHKAPMTATRTATAERKLDHALWATTYCDNLSAKMSTLFPCIHCHATIMWNCSPGFKPTKSTNLAVYSFKYFP